MVVLLLSCTTEGGNVNEEASPETKQDQSNSMNIELLFFEDWGKQIPLTIHETDNSGGFLQVGGVTIRKDRPALNLAAAEGQWQLQSGETTLWSGGKLPQMDGNATFEKDTFDEVLYQGDEEVVLISSGNHLRILKGGQVANEIHERGAGCSEEKEAFIGTYEDGQLNVQFSSGKSHTLEVGPEEDMNGPWVIRSTDGAEWLVSNHKQLRYYQPDGTLIREEALTNDNYAEVLFPRRWDIKQTVVETPTSFLIAISGPTGYGILRYSE